MKISILLPYKENFSPTYPGAVSLFVKDTANLSKYKKNIVVYGNTSFKKKFPIRYQNIPLSEFRFKSKSKQYVEKFISLEKRNVSSIIEIHNRPSYVHILNDKRSSLIVPPQYDTLSGIIDYIHNITNVLNDIIFHIENRKIPMANEQENISRLVIIQFADESSIVLDEQVSSCKTELSIDKLSKIYQGA